MKGVVFLGNRQLELQDFPDPTPGPGDVVLEMKASGMCGSDLHLYRSPGGGVAAAAALGLGGDGEAVIGGHEPCGVVVARGAAVDERLVEMGARVMVHHYKGCGICRSCREGWAQLCDEKFVVYGVTDHGAHAPYIKVPASTLVALPEALSFGEGAAISCGTGTAFGALKRLHLAGGDTLAVFGQGPVGLSATLLGVAMGARVLAVDVGPERLALAQDFGADAVIDADQDDPLDAILALTGGRGVDLALECSANPGARVASIQATRRWGSVCFVGEGGEVTLQVSPMLIRKQLTLIGSWTFSVFGQADCAKFVAEREVPLEKLISHTFKLADAEAAYQLFDGQTTGKGIFAF